MTAPSSSLRERLLMWADELDKDFGCEHNPDFGCWCCNCREQQVKDLLEAAAALAPADPPAADPRDTQIAALREVLTEALDEWAYASAYKGEYLAKKHGDAERIAELRALSAGVVSDPPTAAVPAALAGDRPGGADRDRGGAPGGVGADGEEA